MLFHDGIFLIFILAVILLTSLARGRRSRIWVLLVASYVFYAAWDWRFLGLIVLSTAVDYFIGLALERTQEAQRRKRLLIASLVVNLGLLGVFKYLDFFVDSFNAAFGGAHLVDERPPVGEVGLTGVDAQQIAHEGVETFVMDD